MHTPASVASERGALHPPIFASSESRLQSARVIGTRRFRLSPGGYLIAAVAKRLRGESPIAAVIVRGAARIAQNNNRLSSAGGGNAVSRRWPTRGIE